MKKYLFLLLLAALIAGGLYAWLTCPCAEPPPPESAPPAAAPAPPAAAAPAAPVAGDEPVAGAAQGSATAPSPESPESHPSPAESEPPPPRADDPAAQATAGLPPDRAMEALGVTFRNYAQRFRGNPVGNNAEITAMLNGGNPKQVQFIDAAVHAINDKGELVDAWGTPYFFHQLSGEDMEIRSAGADKVLWTTDDLLKR